MSQSTTAPARSERARAPAVAGLDAVLAGNLPRPVPPDAARLASRPSWLALALVAAATLLALALRLYGLGDRPLWVDEAGTWTYATVGAEDLIETLGRLELTPPGYYLAAKGWIALAGDTEFWLRLPSAVLGAAAVPVFAAFLWRGFGPAAAVWGAGLLAVAATHLRYAQEARVYAILFLLFVLGLLLAARLAELAARRGGIAAGGRARRWPAAAALALVGGAMVHMHFTGVIAVSTLYVYALALLLAQGRLSVAALLPFAAAGLGSVLLAVPVLRLALAIAGDADGAAYWLPVPDVSRAWGEFRIVMFAPQLARFAAPAALLSALALGACLFARRRHPQTVALCAALAFAAVVPLAVSQVTPVLMDRTMLFALALYLALLAGGLSAIRPALLAALVAAAALLPQVAGSARHLLRTPTFYGEAWDTVAEQIAVQARPGDAILAIGAFEAAALDYYLRRHGGALHVTAAVGDAADGVNTVVIGMATHATAVPGPSLATGALCGALRGATGVWLVSREARAYPRLRAAVVQALERSGATEIEAWRYGTLPLERWSAPRCR